ncbi:MAG TPA: DinB family protein [Vicinamibacterales bacterium]|nr:DinB family protein [Vicinamibacterales bacterium]
MSHAVSPKDQSISTPAVGTLASRRAAALADRLEAGARSLTAFAMTLSDAEWQAAVPHDGRKVGVTVDHVAHVYPIEIQVALTVASGEPVTGLTWANIHALNAAHAKEQDGVTKEQAIDRLRRNSGAAAAAIRALSDADLDRAVSISLYEDAPLTCQFFLEDHAVRHSYHHLFLLRRTLKK